MICVVVLGDMYGLDIEFRVYEDVNELKFF